MRTNLLFHHISQYTSGEDELFESFSVNGAETEHGWDVSSLMWRTLWSPALMLPYSRFYWKVRRSGFHVTPVTSSEASDTGHVDLTCLGNSSWDKINPYVSQVSILKLQ